MAVPKKVIHGAPNGFFGPAFFCILRSARELWSGGDHAVPLTKSRHQGLEHAELGRLAGEVRALVDGLEPVRRRIVANTFLRQWMVWWSWILAGLLVAAAVSPKLSGVAVLGVIVAIGGAVGLVIRAWRLRPSSYEAARHLDSAAGLKDRVSTAIYCATAANPDGMILRQRRDALEQFERVRAREEFPMRVPAGAGRALALALVAAGFFAYRTDHPAPILTLLRATAGSHLIQSILSPLERGVEKDLQRTMALANHKTDPWDDEKRAAEERQVSNEGSQAGEQERRTLENGQQELQEVELDQEQENRAALPEGGDTPESQTEMKPGDQQEGQESAGSSAGRPQAASQQQGNARDAAESRSSLAHAIMQALKNMLSNSPVQRDATNQQPLSAQGLPQPGSSARPGTAEANEKQRGSQDRFDQQQKASQKTGSGAGSQQGLKDARKNPPLPVLAVPERVALEANGFKQDPHTRNTMETGVARAPQMDMSPQAVAVINGAEQESIPARYRTYVQRYFEHADNGPR